MFKKIQTRYKKVCFVTYEYFVKWFRLLKEDSKGNEMKNVDQVSTKLLKM